MAARLVPWKNRPMTIDSTSLFLTNGSLFCVYAFVAFGSLRLFATLNASVSPVWPPTGLAIAALLLWGPRLWPGVFFGALAANLLTTGTPPTSTMIAVGNTLEALTGWFLVSRFGNGLHVFERGRTLTVFVLGAGMAAPLLSATIGVTSLAVAGMVQWPAYLAVWTTWLLGDASGALTVAPLLVSIFRHSEPTPPGGLRELGALMGVMIGFGAAIFASAVFSTIPPVPLGFSIVPLVVWAALRFGSRGTTGATFLLSMVAVWGTLERSGPFSSGNINTALLSLQFSVIVLATTGLALAAVVRERLDAEQESRKAKAAERRFQTMVDSAPDAIVIADPEGKIVQVNAQTEAMFGYTRDELVRLKVEDLMPSRYRERHEAHRSIFHATPRRRPMGVGLELFAQRKDGSQFPVEISLSPLHTDAGMVVSSSIRDVSERLRAQEERTRLGTLSAVGEATSMIGHDLRNPLQTISNAAYLTLEALNDKSLGAVPRDQEMKRQVERIRDQTLYMNKIVSDLQDYTRPLKPAITTVQLLELLRDVVASLPRRENVEVSLKFPDESVTIDSDPLMLRRIFSNIVTNALDAMPERGRLLIECLKNGYGVTVHIEDTGEGMGAETLSRIFTPFFTTKPRGQGLGLAVAKRLVEALNGTISVESSPGNGTTFTTEIPSGSA